MLEKKCEYSEPVRQLFIDFKKVRSEVLCYILTDFDISMKIVTLKKKYLNETYIVKSRLDIICLIHCLLRMV
jgi:hypothetical protein